MLPAGFHGPPRQLGLFLTVVPPPQAWEETYSKWDQATKQILNSPKNKADDGQVGLPSVLPSPPSTSHWVFLEEIQVRFVSPPPTPLPRSRSGST